MATGPLRSLLAASVLLCASVRAEVAAVDDGGRDAGAAWPTGAWPLLRVAQVRAVEAQAAAHLPPHTLMQRAGLALARLTLALVRV